MKEPTLSRRERVQGYMAVTVLLLVTACCFTSESISRTGFRLLLPNEWGFGSYSEVRRDSGGSCQDIKTIGTTDGFYSMVRGETVPHDGFC
jgi:hypothetical protein